MKNFLLTISLLVVFLNSQCQDTLTFLKKSNHQKEIILPLNKFSVIIKPAHDKRIRAIIKAYNDSALILKVWTFSRQEKKLHKGKIKALANDTLLEDAQFYSLLNLIKFSKTDTILIRKVDKIIVSNSNRDEMWPIINLTGGIATAWLLGSPFILIIFKSLGSFVAVEVAGICIVTYFIIIENRRINMKKWTIKSSH